MECDPSGLRLKWDFSTHPLTPRIEHMVCDPSGMMITSDPTNLASAHISS